MNTVLVIDSDEDRRSLVTALQGAGFRVVEEVKSGDGLRSAVVEAPSAIIMDEDMPAIDGIELLPVLRRFTDSLIVVKGSGGELAAAQALLQGADLYLPRWVSVKEALVRVHALLHRLVTGKEPSEGAYSTSGNGDGNGFHPEMFPLL